MKPLVVLLHGLARGHGSMARLGAYLRHEGFETWSRPYPARRHPNSYLASEPSDDAGAPDAADAEPSEGGRAPVDAGPAPSDAFVPPDAEGIPIVGIRR